MKTNVQFICDKCGTVYSSPEQAIACEAGHYDVDALELHSARHWRNSNSHLPMYITVRFMNNDKLFERSYCQVANDTIREVKL